MVDEKKALFEIHKYYKCLESEVLINKILSTQYYWLKTDTWAVERKRNE